MVPKRRQWQWSFARGRFVLRAGKTGGCIIPGALWGHIGWQGRAIPDTRIRPDSPVMLW